MKKGFTLAEVLITLGIIGVVAALVMPGLINNYQKKVAVTRLAQTYSMLAQAVKLSEVENGEMQNWLLTGATTKDTQTFIDTYLTPYLKNVKRVYLPYSSAPYPYYFRDGTPINGGTHYSIALSNGVYLHFDQPGDGLSVRVDINGEQKPNMVGRDTFWFQIFPQFTTYAKGTARNTLIQRCQSKVNSEWRQCTTLIELDGWQIKDDYPW